MYNGYITFNGIKSSDYGVIVYDGDIFQTPKRDVEEVEVAGRNGVYVIDNGRWADVSISYSCYIETNAMSKFLDFKAKMMANNDYCELIDMNQPDYVFKARLTSISEPTFYGLENGCKFKINFTRAPQRYLKSGMEEISVSKGETITNNTLYDAKPLIYIKGTGECTIKLNDIALTISNINEYMYIDCESMNCYRQTGELQNNYVSFDDNNIFPYISPGDNVISWTGDDISEVKITPRWWTI